MKLLIQIPCYNEEENLENVIKAIPKGILGINEIKTLILNDGSCDNTEKIASKYNLDIINSQHVGLSNIFKKGVNYAIENDFDLLVNLDGDNQYDAGDIEKLIKPILEENIDMTIGARPIDEIQTFSLTKKFLQRFGSFVVKTISKTDVKDATSGFRAFNKKTLLKLNIFNNYTYTIESIIQTKFKNLSVKSIDVKVNPQKNRKSKLIKNNFEYIFKQAINLIRCFIIYKPVQFFGKISFLLFITGLILGIRFLYYFINHQGTGHVQSLILCSIILVLSFIVANIAILSDIISINRKLLEDIQEKIQKKK